MGKIVVFIYFPLLNEACFSNMYTKDMQKGSSLLFDIQEIDCWDINAFLIHMNEPFIAVRVPLIRMDRNSASVRMYLILQILIMYVFYVTIS